MSWDAPLSRSLTPRDHAPLVTLADARAYMLELPDNIAEWNVWQHAAKLLLEAAESPTKAAIEAAADQVERALFLSYRMGPSKI